MITGAPNRFLLVLNGECRPHRRVLCQVAAVLDGTFGDAEHTSRYVSTHDVCNESDSHTGCRYTRGGYASYIDMDNM